MNQQKQAERIELPGDWSLRWVDDGHYKGWFFFDNNDVQVVQYCQIRKTAKRFAAAVQPTQSDEEVAKRLARETFNRPHDCRVDIATDIIARHVASKLVADRASRNPDGWDDALKWMRQVAQDWRDYGDNTKADAAGYLIDNLPISLTAALAPDAVVTQSDLNMDNVHRLACEMSACSTMEEWTALAERIAAHRQTHSQSAQAEVAAWREDMENCPKDGTWVRWGHLAGRPNLFTGALWEEKLVKFKSDSGYWVNVNGGVVARDGYSIYKYWQQINPPAFAQQGSATDAQESKN